MQLNEKTASLAVVDYEALATKDADEIKKLVEACQTKGLFYLKLWDTRASAVFENVPVLFKTGQDFFHLPSDSEEKTRSLCEGMERGYHVFKGFEYYEIARDEYYNGSWVLPSSLEPQKERITNTMNLFHGAMQTILAELCAALDITTLELTDDPTIPSDTALKLVHKSPLDEPGHVMQPWHTDTGLITMLWYDKVMAQIPVRDQDGKQTEEAAAIPVRDGCVLVNIADELAAKSGGRLHSPVHRAVSPPGEVRVWDGLVYLLRPYKV